ncbi:amyM [Scenedesmus sp. PABB004]|nr:amyM [Scenedesmus sp. PABB004]
MQVASRAGVGAKSAAAGVAPSAARRSALAAGPVAAAPAAVPSRSRTVRVAAYRDCGVLRDAQTMRFKHILSTYNKAHAVFPKVKFVLKHNSRLGEVWKLSGNSPELGNWVPEISPCLSWQDGGVWSAEVALPPGNYSFKCMLRRADGSYVWEAGENRQLSVPVKDRAGHMVLTYHMDVRTEPVESLSAPAPGKYGVMQQGEPRGYDSARAPAADRAYASAGARW